MLDRSALRNLRPLIMARSHDGTFCFTYVASVIQLMGSLPTTACRSISCLKWATAW